MKERITVFTPTYNRAHTLPRLYESLKRQDNKNFLWLIIDDGSTDNTRSLVEKWVRSVSDFRIEYHYQENRGVHMAHEKAYSLIDTELNICIDSDDIMADGAINRILDIWDSRTIKKCAGIIGLDADFDGKIVGTKFPTALVEITIDDCYRGRWRGDKKWIDNTQITKTLPKCPYFKGEKYFGIQAYKRLFVPKGYTYLPVNEVFCNIEYQPDGQTNNMLCLYRDNPQGFKRLRITRMRHVKSVKRKFMDCIHYVSSCIILRDKNWFRDTPKKTMTILAIPFGIMLYVYIMYKTRGVAPNTFS